MAEEFQGSLAHVLASTQAVQQAEDDGAPPSVAGGTGRDDVGDFRQWGVVVGGVGEHEGIGARGPGGQRAVQGYRELARSTGRTIPVLVEVDTGMNRVGAAPAAVVKLAEEVSRAPGLEFRGVMTHAGHSHDASDELGIEAVGRQEAAVMGGVREDLEAAGLDVPVASAGSSITSAYLTAADGITEIRPGTYVYNDLRILGRHACTPDALAATVLATVVSTSGRRITIDAGSKTLTPTKDATYGYGHLRHRPGAVFTRLSEEHGVLDARDDLSMPSIGDKVQVLPVHVCVWMDLQAEVYGVRGGRVVERITVDAMRHSL
ncbi:alanine racemase [Streptomyces sp. NPDC002619]|uniref:alanine racemase n=1 Tax=Streptomyces sp. NPDC002619 TaxID=3364655 RepID=UPI0036801F8D